MFQKVFLRTTRARRFRSGMIVLCAIGAIVLVAVGPSPLLALGTVTMRVDPATRAVPVNGTFTVDIVADLGTEMNPDGLGAYEFDLVYEPDYLEVVTGGVTDAGELGATGRTVTELGPNITTTIVTTMTFAAYSHPPLDANGPVSPTVVLATATLQAKQAGVKTLNLENALLTDTQANAWPDGGTRILDTSGGKVWILLDAFFNAANQFGDVADWDGDGIADAAVYVFNRFYWLQSSLGGQKTSKYLGFPGVDSIPVPADYDGDGKTDPAIWAFNRFYWKQSDSSYQMTNVYLGWDDAIPTPADFDGDGLADPAVWRTSTRRFTAALSGSSYQRWSSKMLNYPGAIPVPGDYDGDSKADAAVYAFNRFYWLQSSLNYQKTSKYLGFPNTDPTPVPGDYDGDGKVDPGIWEFNRFYWKQSSADYQLTNVYLGWDDAIPAAADWDNDGLADPAVWRTSTRRYTTALSGSSYQRWSSKMLNYPSALPVK